ncbi:MAG: exopolysaccharide biosynthesis protein, partial [Pseudomonadota bacterium]
DKAGLTRMARFGRTWFGWLEWVAFPRLTLLSSKPAERLVALFLTAFCASILIPLPGTNTVPGIAVAIAAFGLMSRDGLLILLGLVLGCGWLAFLILGGKALITAILARI